MRRAALVVAVLAASAGLAEAQSRRPEPRLTDVVAEADGRITIEIEEAGWGSIAGIRWNLIVDGQVAETSPPIPGPGRYTSSARVLGTDRFIGIQLDPSNALLELSERNQSVTRRVTVSHGTRADLRITDLRDSGQLLITVKNVGGGTYVGGEFGRFRIWLHNSLVDTRSVVLPRMLAGQSVSLTFGRSYGVGATKVALDGYPTDGDTTNNWRLEHLPAGPDLAPLWSLFGRPEIRDVTVWVMRSGAEFPYRNWTDAMFDELARSYVEILEGRDPLPPRPVRPPEQCTFTEWEAMQIYLAYLAQSAWFELHDRRWSISAMASADWRKAVLGSGNLVRPDISPAHRFMNCWWSTGNTWSPFFTRFMPSLRVVASTHRSTVLRLGDYIRENVQHLVQFTDPTISEGEVHWGSSSGSPEAVIYAAIGDTGVSSGCGMTSSLLLVLLRSVNVPVVKFSTYLIDGNHMSAKFPSISLRMVHGDDFYSSFARMGYELGETVPIEDVLVSEAFWQAELEAPVPECVDGVCNTTGVQRSMNAHRLFVARLIARMPTLFLFVTSVPAQEHVLDFVFEGAPGAVAPAVPLEERQEILDAARDRFLLWGDGDDQRGRDEALTAQDAIATRFTQITY